jgi:hypothetical protein
VSGGRFVGRYRLPHIDGKPSQARAASRAILSLTKDANERAVLGVVIDHADGAGACFLTIARLTHLAGISSGKYAERTVQRVLRRLREKELLEVYASLRDPKRYRSHLPRHARQGRGPNWYRLGGLIRAAAGYREVDVIEIYGGAPAPPQIASVSPPSLEQTVSDSDPRQPPPSVTSEFEQPSPPTLEVKHADSSVAAVTPRTENYGRPLNEEQRLVLNSTEQELSSRGDTKQEAPLHNAREMVSALPLREALIVLEADELVASGDAAWVEPGWSA